jgi:hypothetical protein
MTAELIARTEEIVPRAEREGWDPHDEVTKLVERTVLGGMSWARQQDEDQARQDDRDIPER